jgi:hypothetical protein
MIMLEDSAEGSLPNGAGPRRRRAMEMNMKGKVTATTVVEDLPSQDEELLASADGNSSSEDGNSSSADGNSPLEESSPLKGYTPLSNTVQNADQQIISKEPTKTARKKRSSKGSNKGGKLVKAKKGGGKKSMQRPYGKGKGKGKGVQPPNGCMSAVAEDIVDAVPEVITQNPSRCCYTSGLCHAR